jgi:hypothetical protein
MKWGLNEIERLSPILEQISSDLTPVEGTPVLVLCSILAGRDDGTGESHWIRA